MVMLLNSKMQSLCNTAIINNMLFVLVLISLLLFSFDL